MTTNDNLYKTKKVFKAIFAWEDEKEEKWLSEMSAQGWHLLSTAPFFYEFIQGAPRQYAYRLDYKFTTDKDHAEYVQIFQDTGWKLVAEMANWHYWRAEAADGVLPEIYNDNASKAAKYRRLLLFLIIFLPIIILYLPPGLLWDYGRYSDTVDITVTILGFLMKIIYTYALIRIFLKLLKFNKASRE